MSILQKIEDSKDIDWNNLIKSINVNEIYEGLTLFGHVCSWANFRKDIVEIFVKNGANFYVNENETCLDLMNKNIDIILECMNGTYENEKYLFDKFSVKNFKELREYAEQVLQYLIREYEI